MDDFLLDENSILERVDEYTLYCYYLDFSPDIGMKYTSPIRPGDETPSFGIFPARRIPNREYGWKDQGGTGKSGDIFKLVQEMLSLAYGPTTRQQAVLRIMSDFGLGPTVENKPLRIVQYQAKSREPMEIRANHRPFKSEDDVFWQQYNISRSILQEYLVNPIVCYWSYATQAIPKFPRGLGYEYLIAPKRKLYFPQERKEFKFRNDLTERELEGFAQLRYNTDTLVITKSYKDVMCLRSFEYEAVAPRSENTLIVEPYLNYLESKYKRIFILFDNDGKHKADEYKYNKIWVPKESGEKDLTDFCKHYGPQATAELLKQLI